MLRLDLAIVIIFTSNKLFLFSIFISGSHYLYQPSSTTKYCSSGYFMTITYGRWYCHNGTATVTTRMNTNCYYDTQCTITADNPWTGINPCPGLSKTLYWTSTCSGKCQWVQWVYWFWLVRNVVAQSSEYKTWLLKTL